MTTLQRSTVAALLLCQGLTDLGRPAPAKAGLLRPVLMLMRPQLEQRLARVCVETASGGRPDLERTLQDPCRKLAAPTSKCLIEETDATGRGLGVLSEMLGGRFGGDTEVVVKRCLARMFGLPADSLKDVPLRELGQRFANRKDPGTGTPAP
ncbi:MAG: hypothetical protein ACKOBY_11715 [Cyanobium sp.]